MQTPNIWHKFDLYWRKALILLLFSLCYLGSSAQRNVQMNNPNYDDRFLSYGFLIGILHSSAYQVKYSEEFVSRDLDSVYSITPRWSPGFSLGFIVNMRLGEFFDLRVLPKVAFYEHELEYQRLDEPVINELVETTVVELPLLIKYKSIRRTNTRMYFVGGLKPGIEASGKNDVESVGDDNLSVNKFNLSLDFGFGMDIYFPLFKFSPEIRFSKGLTNMLGPVDNQFSAGIDKLNTNTITLYLLFQ